MNDAIEAFKAIGEPTRFRLLRLLVDADLELCACELADALEKPQYTISKSVAALVAAGLIAERREGRMMFYRLEHSAVNDALFAAVAAAPRDGELAADSVRLGRRLAEREKDNCVRC